MKEAATARPRVAGASPGPPPPGPGVRLPSVPFATVLFVAAALFSVPAAALELPARIDLVPNLDDDDRDGQADWRQRRASADDNDIVWLSLEGPLKLRLAVDRGRLQLRLPDQLLVEVAASGERRSLVGPGPVSLGIGSAAPGSAGRLFIGEHEVEVRTAPMILPPALSPIELAVVAIPEPEEPGGPDLVAALHRDLGARLVLLPGEPNQWFQDQVEIATFVTADARLDLAFTDEAADPLRSFLAEEDDLALDRRDHWDEFGNIEVSPPVTVHGRRHPWGRVLFGTGSADPERDAFLRRLARDGVQSTVPLDVGWLSVGHVDEVVAFVPDASASQGFVALIPDPRLGLEVLDAVEPTHPTPRYLDHRRPGGGWQDAGELQADPLVRWFNEALAVGPLLRIRVTLIEELGLRWEEVIGLPALFEPNPDDPGRGASALTPNPANMVVVDAPGEAGWLALLSDPWFRSPEAPPTADPFAVAIERALAGRAGLRLLDTWDAYHAWGGEIHCGAGLRRGLPQDWHAPCCAAERSRMAPGGPPP